MPGEFDFGPYAVGGAARPDSFSGLSPEFRASLAKMLLAAPPEIQQALRITSGYRSPERQAELWQGALTKYGSPEAARKWVAPPGRSNHNHGQAVDLKYLSPAATEWAHANAQQFGLHFPLSNENWHVEPIGARGGQPAPASVASAYTAPEAPAAPVAAELGQPVQAARPSFGQMAMLFAEQRARRQEVQRAEQDAEAARRAALFDPGALFGIYA